MKALFDFIKKFTDDDFLDKNFIVKIEDRFYITNQELMKVKEKTAETPFSEGIYLGREQAGKLIPTAYLLEMIRSKTNKTTKLNNKAAFLYTCGKNVFKSSILSSKVQKGPTIVVDENDTLLGYGQVDMEKNIAIKNIFDIGSMLRREMTKEPKTS